LTNTLYFDKVVFMLKDSTTVWKRDTTQQLTEVLTSINSTNDMQNFLRDVMTEKEIVEISSRLEAARMLTEGASYVFITKQTKLSSRTVARISNWLKNGCNGYQIALNVINHDNHILPASAE